MAQDDAAVKGIDGFTEGTAELVGQRVDSLDDPHEFDKAMALVGRPLDAGPRVVEQGIQIAALGQGLGDFLETLVVLCDRAVDRIRLDRRRDLGVKPGRFTRQDSHFPTVGQLEINGGSIGGNDGFAFANHIAALEPAHVTGAIPGKRLAGKGRNFGDHLRLSHDGTPDEICDEASLRSTGEHSNCTKVQFNVIP